VYTDPAAPPLPPPTEIRRCAVVHGATVAALADGVAVVDGAEGVEVGGVGTVVAGPGAVVAGVASAVAAVLPDAAGPFARVPEPLLQPAASNAVRAMQAVRRPEPSLPSGRRPAQRCGCCVAWLDMMASGASWWMVDSGCVLLQRPVRAMV